MTPERISELRGILGPNWPGRPGAAARAVAYECLNECIRLAAVVEHLQPAAPVRVVDLQEG